MLAAREAISVTWHHPAIQTKTEKGSVYKNKHSYGVWVLTVDIRGQTGNE